MAAVLRPRLHGECQEVVHVGQVGGLFFRESGCWDKLPDLLPGQETRALRHPRAFVLLRQRSPSLRRQPQGR